VDCPEVFGRVPVSLFMAVRWSPVRTRPRKQTALAVYLKRKKTKLPGGVLPRNERAEIAFEEWCVTKRVRETVAGMLENEVPSPTSNLLVLSKRQLEHYWRQVGQVIKHTNLLWKTKWIKWSAGYKSSAECVVEWQTMDPVSLDANFAILIPILRRLLSQPGLAYRDGLDKFRETLLRKLENRDDRVYRNLEKAQRLDSFVPCATEEYRDQLLQKPKYIRKYFAFVGVNLSRTELSFLAFCFPLKTSRKHKSAQASKVPHFDLPACLAFIDGANLDDYKPLSKLPGTEQRAVETAPRTEWNMNDALGTRTAFLVEQFLESLESDKWLGMVGFVGGKGGSGHEKTGVFIRADGQRVVTVAQEEGSSGDDGGGEPEMGAEPRAFRYAGWDWARKREEAVVTLKAIMKQFASDLVEATMKKRLEYKLVPAKPELTRHFVMAKSEEARIELEGSRHRLASVENPEDDMDGTSSVLVEGDREDGLNAALDQSTMLCLRWAVDKHAQSYRLEQKVEHGYYTICLDPPVTGDVDAPRPTGSFDVMSLSPNTRYEFRLTAYNKNGPSRTTRSAFVTTPGIPRPPQVVSVVYSGRNTAALTICWGMNVYNEWVKHLKEDMFNPMKTGQTKLPELVQSHPILKRFLRSCQKKKKKDFNFDDFKAYCAFQNYGLSDADFKKFQVHEKRLLGQLEHPDLGMGMLKDSAEQTALIVPSAKSSHELKRTMKYAGYEVWCKRAFPVSEQVVGGGTGVVPAAFEKVWEGKGDACTIVHLQLGNTYSFYVRARNECGQLGAKSDTIDAFVKEPTAGAGDGKLFPKNVTDNHTLPSPPAPAIVSRSGNEVIVRVQQAHIPGAGAYSVKLESRLVCSINALPTRMSVWKCFDARICKPPEVPSPVRSGTNKSGENVHYGASQSVVATVDVAPEYWRKVYETHDNSAAVLIVGLRPNAIYQFRARMLDEHLLPGSPSDWSTLDDLATMEKKGKVVPAGKLHLSTVFAKIVSSPEDLFVGDAICFIEHSSLDGPTVLAGRLLRNRGPSRPNFVVEVLWAARLRKNVSPKEFVPEKSLLGPAPFTPGYHTGSLLFRSPESIFKQSKQVFRARWVEEHKRVPLNSTL
jgi:hypothetical protein